MKARIIKLNPGRMEVVDFRDSTKLRDLPENACCSRIRGVDAITLPSLGIHETRVNFCWICGRKLR